MTSISASLETKEQSESDSNSDSSQSDETTAAQDKRLVKKVKNNAPLTIAEQQEEWSKKNDGIVAVMVSEDPEVNPRAAKIGRTMKSSNAASNAQPPKDSTKTLKLKSVGRKRMRRPGFQKKSSMKA
ncbi:hypothetical protein OROMI_004080 [Orobanche minor]